MGANFFNPNDGQGGGGIGVPVDHWIGVQTADYQAGSWHMDNGDEQYPQPQGTLSHHGHSPGPQPRREYLGRQKAYGRTPQYQRGGRIRKQRGGRIRRGRR